MGFDISVADIRCVNVEKRSHDLVSVELHENIRETLSLLLVVTIKGIDRLRNEWHDDMQVLFIGVFPLAEISVDHLENIWVVKFFENLEFSIFVSLIL